MNPSSLDLRGLRNRAYAFHRLLYQGEWKSMVRLFFRENRWQIEPFVQETPATCFLVGTWEWKEDETLLYHGSLEEIKKKELNISPHL